MVRELHAAGHHIIIHTARRMRTHSGNVSAVVADVGQITIQSLKRFGIPYDEVRAIGWTGKPPHGLRLGLSLVGSASR